jgi:hypothetical protein
VWTLYVAASYVHGAAENTSAVQQAAQAGEACALLIFGYILARALDFIVQRWSDASAVKP